MACSCQGNVDTREARQRLARFLRGDQADRLFRHPTCHPAHPTGFCACDRSHLETLRIWLRGALLEAALKLPFNELKVRFLRRLGVRIGRDVYVSVGAWIDPVFPQLLYIEDGVFIGMGAHIFTHEFRRDEFRAGRVIIRRGAFIGGYSLIGCGIEIGEGATVAAGTVLGCDVPAGCTALGNPPRIIHQRHAQDEEGKAETTQPDGDRGITGVDPEGC
jgi:acetyltransferase-like isoleucine patch superfamily enzyme